MWREIPAEEVERRARELGMVYREEVIAFPDFKPLEESHGEEVSTSSEQNLSFEGENDEIKVVIPRGSTSEKVARILKKAGLITSEKDFLRYVATQNLTYKLKAGKFTFTKGATLDQIIKTLTD